MAQHPQCFNDDGSPITVVVTSTEITCDSEGGQGSPNEEPDGDGFYPYDNPLGNTGSGGNSNGNEPTGNNGTTNPNNGNGDDLCANESIDNGSGNCVDGLTVPVLSPIAPRDALISKLDDQLTSLQVDWINTADFNVVFALNNFLQNCSFSNQSECNIFTTDLISTIMLDVSVDEDALNFMLEAYNQDKIYNNLDDTFLNSVNQFINIDIVENPLIGYQIELYFTTKCAVLRYNHPEWSDIKIYWEASKDLVHIALDGFGMIPVAGEIADLANGVLYLIEGDGVNATLSFAATVPIAGWASTGAKYAIKIVDASTIATKAKLTWKVLENGVIYFGSSGSKLRKVLGLTDSALHAHHLMPWAFRNHDVIQKAAKSENAIHLNEALNGIARPNSLHLTGHNVYNDVIEDILNEFNPNASVSEAYDFISGFTSHIRDLITNNPTLNSGQIADLISFP